MPRTPLLRSLSRALSLALAEEKSGLPHQELKARWRAAEGRRREGGEAGLSRRELLHAASLAGAGLALGSCTTWSGGWGGSGRRGDAEVVIAGGGIAGLTAGYRLARAGVGVRILEAQPRTGGRMLSLRDHFADSQVAELGGELIDTGHTAIRSLAAELEIPLDDLSTDDPALGEVFFFAGRRRSEEEIAAAFRPVARRIREELAALGDPDGVTYREPSGAEALDRTTLAEWLAAADAEPWMRRLLEVAYTTEYGLEADRQSALNLHFLIDPNPDPFRIFGDSDERFHVQGGNDLIPRALAERLGERIETGARLEAVRQRPDGGFELAVRRGAASSTLTAPHLVLALPFTLLREVQLDVELPAVKRRAIAELGYGTNAKLMIGFSERVWRRRHRGNGSVLTDLPFQLTWETSRLQGGEAGILTNFTGGDHGVELGQGTAAEQAAQAVAGMETVFPGVEAARAGMKEARFHWPSHPWTRGSYACYLPGQWTGLCGAEGESAGRLHFIGEHCSLEAQGFMEGGCETGEAVARTLLAELGRGSLAAARPPLWARRLVAGGR